jgi:hypothetical protein
MWATAAAYPAARAAAAAAGALTSRAAPPPTNRRRIPSATSSSPRVKARVRAIASRGRRSSGASASNNHSTRSAQSAAHAATIRRSPSLSVCGEPIATSSQRSPCGRGAWTPRLFPRRSAAARHEEPWVLVAASAFHATRARRQSSTAPGARSFFRVRTRPSPLPQRRRPHEAKRENATVAAGTAMRPRAPARWAGYGERTHEDVRLAIRRGSLVPQG